MHTAYLVFAWITVALNVTIAVADYLRAPFVLANSAEVNTPEGWLPGLATLKLAGGVGIALGVIAGVPALTLAAAIGLMAFFVGALAFHVRAKVFYNIAFPGMFLAVATATALLSLRELAG